MILEINRKLYLNEASKEKSIRYQEIKLHFYLNSVHSYSFGIDFDSNVNVGLIIDD
jgi:hypothetical protein